MTDKKDKSGIAQAPRHMRREMVQQDEHASILKSLARVDLLVLLAVALYALALGGPPASARVLYAALAAYAEAARTEAGFHHWLEANVLEAQSPPRRAEASA